MYILTIETTGPVCSVALLEKNKILAKRSTSEQKNHLRDLVPLIGRTIEDAGISKENLEYVAVSTGPGSFTGIRIGVTTARALGQVMGLPLIGVPTLDAFCRKSRMVEDGIICGIINARRGQVYGIVENHMEGRACMLTDVLEVLKENVLPAGEKVNFFGDEIDAYRRIILEELGKEGYLYEKDFFFAPEEDRYQDAASAGLIAFEKATKGETVEVGELLPDYMRKAEAQQKLEAGQLPICRGPKQE